MGGQREYPALKQSVSSILLKIANLEIGSQREYPLGPNGSTLWDAKGATFCEALLGLLGAREEEKELSTGEAIQYW